VVVPRHDRVEGALGALAVGEEIEGQEQDRDRPSQGRHNARPGAHEIAADPCEYRLHPCVRHGAGEGGGEGALLEQRDQLFPLPRGVADDLGELLEKGRNGQENQQARDEEQGDEKQDERVGALEATPLDPLDERVEGARQDQSDRQEKHDRS